MAQATHIDATEEAGGEVIFQGKGGRIILETHNHCTSDYF